MKIKYIIMKIKKTIYLYFIFIDIILCNKILHKNKIKTHLSNLCSNTFFESCETITHKHSFSAIPTNFHINI